MTPTQEASFWSPHRTHPGFQESRKGWCRFELSSELNRFYYNIALAIMHVIAVVFEGQQMILKILDRENTSLGVLGLLYSMHLKINYYYYMKTIVLANNYFLSF